MTTTNTSHRIRYEVCVDSAAGARVAQDAGAHRVELCSALFVGGVTPSAGLIEATVAAAPAIGVHVLIRPRGGDFIYDDDEIRIMVRDIETAAALGAHGTVIGALTAEGDIDTPTVRRMLTAAGGLSVTFHRAFDMARDQFAALKEVVALGVHRVLTSGGESTALEGAPRLAELIRAADNRVVIMPGGGSTPVTPSASCGSPVHRNFTSAPAQRSTARLSTATPGRPWAVHCATMSTGAG
ncbi:copper homeostasis protein CutC [Streptomyces chiangmaiensis]